MQNLTRTTLLALVCVLPLRADEVKEHLESAVAAYSSGNYTEALQAADFASQLIRQKKSEAVAELLPPAPSGWEAEEVENESSSMAMLGGVVAAKRSYQKGDSYVSIQIQSDSPLLQSFGMMFANPVLMSGSGAKLETIKGQRAAVTYRANDKSGDVKIMVDGRYLVSVEGNGVSRDELLRFVQAIDYTKLSQMK